MDAISMDVRLLIIEALDDGETVPEITLRLNVSTSTVGRVRRALKAGIIGPKAHGGGRQRSIDLFGRELLRRLVWQKADRSWYELARLYNELRHTSLSRHTIQRDCSVPDSSRHNRERESGGALAA
jgi:transposase